jgi:paraquat-inducible protein B
MESFRNRKSTLVFAQASFAAELATLEADSPLQTDVHTSTAQLRRTLARVNALVDYFERHRESIECVKLSSQ